MEYAFNATRLREVMIGRLQAQGVITNLNTTVDSVRSVGAGLAVNLRRLNTETTESYDCDHVFNCTYSLLNELNRNSNLPLIPLKHELAELCLVRVPPALQRVGITVMCGPFFSIMPFPSTDLHSFSHVRYTPHFTWHDNDPSPSGKPLRARSPLSTSTAWTYMQRDAARYVPLLAECQYERSIWEVKTVLPQSETDDSRPILFLPNHGMDGYHCLMGGKIDNIYDVITAIKSTGLHQ